MSDREQLVSAVVDRIEEGVAVILVGDEETEHHLPITRLPRGIHEGSWVKVRLGPDLSVVELDPEGEQRQQQRIQERLERLRRDRRGGRFSS